MINTNLNKKNSLLQYYQFTKAEQKKYPVISRILKKLTSERIKTEREVVKNTKLPRELQRWVKEYEKVGERKKFLWKWLYRGDETVIKAFNFPEKYYQLVVETTFLFNMFITLLDDLSERKEGDVLLAESLKIPFYLNHIRFDSLNKKEGGYLAFVIKVWLQLEEKLKNYPYHKEVRNIFEYDISQLLNATKYSFLIYNKPYLANQLEYWMYSPHNMQVIITFNLYLMCSFDANLKKEFGKCREAILYLQKMARIGNCLGTWEKEVKENDFTSSGVLTYAVNSSVLNFDDLNQKNKLRLIKEIKNSKFEKDLFEEWDKSYCKISKIGKEIKKINIEKLLSVIEKITLYHLASKGKI